MRWIPRPADEVALRMLDARFGAFGTGPDGIGRPDGMGVQDGGAAVRLTAFQEEARARVDVLLKRYRGAVLADSVGLGKTYVALDLVAREVAAGGRVAVIVPAALRAQWRRLLHGLGDGWTLHTHTALSRGRGPALAHAPSLVVLDEAHRFRNPRTRRYAAMAGLTWAEPGPRVLLITATPVNNHPRDLLHLLRLFMADDALVEDGVPSLTTAFGPDRPDTAVVNAVIDAIVVRRTRSLLADRFGAAPVAVDAGATAPRFPRCAAPSAVRYRDDVLPRLVAGISDLELAPYRLPAGGDGAAALLRLNLLKRLDSSPAAFLASLRWLRRSLSTVRDAARAGRVLGPGRQAGGRGDDDPLQLLLVEVVADAAPPDLDLPALAESVDRDLDRLDRMKALRGGDDPKGDALAALLSRVAPAKVVVFTEYRDTAVQLWRALRGTLRTARVDGAGAWLGNRPAGRRAVVERFAPVANGRAPPPDRERVDVLIATDVLAEGLNLQDAQHVISYDLPWNPVRLMQRIGRVDRLGSTHPVVVPHLFVPSSGLDAMLGLRRRLLAKLDGIADTGGAEDAGPLLAALAGDRPEREDPMADGATDPIEALRTLWVRNRRPGARRPPRDRPGTAPYATVAVSCRTTGAPGWIVAVRDRGRGRILEVGADGGVREATADTVAALECVLDGSSPLDPAAARAKPDHGSAPDPLAGPPPPRWLELRLREFLRRRAWERMAVPELPSSSPARRLTRYLTRALAAAGVTAGPDRVRRAGTLLQRLACPLDPAAELRAKAVLDDVRRETAVAGGTPRHRACPETRIRGGGPSLDAAMDRIQHVLGDPVIDPDPVISRGVPTPGSRVPAGRLVSAEETAVLAALRVVPMGPAGRLTTQGGEVTFARLPFPRSSAGRAGGC